MGGQAQDQGEYASVAKKKRAAKQRILCQNQRKTREGSKISADIRCCILNSTASYNLTPRLSERLWGEEETRLSPSIIQCVCVPRLCVRIQYVCICVCLCDVMSCLIGQVPNFALYLPGDYNMHWQQAGVCPPSLFNAGILDALY